VTIAKHRIKLAPFPDDALMSPKTAVLLTNLGTPAALDKPSVKQFLKEFLSDPMVVEIPRLLWWLILNGLILPFRSGKTLQGYQRIWMDEGSPLMVYAQRQQAALQQKLGDGIPVALAMRYGQPSFKSVIAELLAGGANRLIVLPLYPQNSATTTATTFQHLARTLTEYRNQPSVDFINSYYQHSAYIEALAESVRNHWAGTGSRNHLVMSFHGLPQVNVDRGDPYYGQCLVTAKLLARELDLDKSQWSHCFQSRFGKQVWLKPYTTETLTELSSNGVKFIDVICPGFSADCLETLDEIQIEYRGFFIEQGGEQLHYIPALNDRDTHIKMMQGLVSPYLVG
jgi:ferrochelatase